MLYPIELWVRVTSITERALGGGPCLVDNRPPGEVRPRWFNVPNRPGEARLEVVSWQLSVVRWHPTAHCPLTTDIYTTRVCPGTGSG